MIRKLTLTLLSTALCCAPAQAVTFDWATVGDPGNVDDNTGYGGVDYVYRISKHEVTNAQYAEFLNAVAATEIYSLTLYSPGMGITRSGDPGSYTYSVKPDAIGKGPGGADGNDYTYANKPVNYVRFFSALRFVNWLHNGQGSGDTESGVYAVPTGPEEVEVRSASAKFWLPSEDEWYKAAYYDPHANDGSGAYYNYATSSDTRPDNNLPSGDSGNSANFPITPMGTFGYTTGDEFYPMTDVGAYSLSKSPYGTFDQSGNVEEWTETVHSNSARVVRGGSWGNFSPPGVTYRFPTFIAPHSGRIGFRIATVYRAPGDFNGDGVVDGADFLFWQRDPNVGDLAEWQTHFGAPVSATGYAVPEPTTLPLALPAVALAAIFFRPLAGHPNSRRFAQFAAKKPRSNLGSSLECCVQREISGLC